MSNALSMDLRVRFKRLMDGGMRAAKAGKVLMLSPATAARWGNKVRNGASLVPLHSGAPKGGGKLAPYFDFFVELIEQDADITLEELKSSLLMAHEVTCSTSGIDALLRRRGYTYKKKG